MKNKKNIFIYAGMIAFICSVLIGSSAVGIEYFWDFDDGIVGNMYGDSILEQVAIAGHSGTYDWNLSDNTSRSGFISNEHGAGRSGMWYFNESITSFSCYVYIEALGDSSNTLFHFQNATQPDSYSADDSIRIMVRETGACGSVFPVSWVDSGEGDTLISNINVGEWNYIAWEKIDSYNVKYTVNEVVLYDPPTSPLTEDVTKIYFHGNLGVGGCESNYYIDDVRINGASPEYDVSMWEVIGDFEPRLGFHTIYSEIPYWVNVEHDYNIEIDTEIKAIDLLVSEEQYNDDSDPTKYVLKISDGTGHHVPYTNSYVATTFISYGDNYILRWYDMSIQINDTKIVLEVDHEQKLIVGMSEYDLDDDGDIQYYAYISDEDGNYYSRDGYYNHPQGNEFIFDKDLCIKIYHTGVGSTVPAPDVDSIDTDKNNVDLFKPVNIVWATTDLSVDNFLSVSDGLSEVLNVTITSFWGNKYYVPETVATHTCSLIREGVTVASCTFDVNEINEEYYIYTKPNPSKIGEIFTTYFNYSGTVPCAIILRDNREGLINRWIFNDVPLKSNFTYSLNSEGIYFFDLCYIINMSGETVYTLKQRHIHITKDEYTNAIYFQREVCEWNYDFNRYDYNLIYYTHNFLGSNIVLRFNGVEDKDISQSSDSNYLYKPSYSGTITVTMELILSDSTLILDTKTFTVIAIGEEEIEDLGVTHYKFFIGLGILLMFTFMGLGIAVKAQQDLMPMATLFAVIGALVGVVLGVIPLYFIFILGALLIGWIVTKLMPS